MFFQQVVHSDLGCASYIVASTSGEAVVVDPRWEIEPYLETAAARGLRITRIVETHNHADHVSGHGRLAAHTGATILIHETAGVDYDHQSLTDGDVIDMSDVRLHVVHTPGHRPEHISLAIEDVSRGSDAWIVLTGDSLFVGDVARPDLAVDGSEGARLLFDSLHGRLLNLPEFAAIYPAHVAGSLCGRVSSEVFSSTLGYEKRYNHALAIHDRDQFVAYMNENLPQRPPNMQRIVAENRGPLHTEWAKTGHLAPEAIERAIAGGAIPLDVRPTDEYLQAHIKGSIHVPVTGAQFGTRASFVLPAETSIVIIATDAAEAQLAAVSLRVVAVDSVEGFVAFDEWRASGREVRSIGQMSVSDLSAALAQGTSVVDVREANEWADGMVPGAVTVAYRELSHRTAEIPSAGRVAVMCGSGGRSAIGASLLERAGFHNIVNVDGGMSAWLEAGLPVGS